jgi:hypothetical protein
VGAEVALASRVDDQRPLPGAAEHQSGAQAGGSRADDDAVPELLHAVRVRSLGGEGGL